MKQQSRLATIAALTLGFCLIATQALAAVHGLTNSSGGAIEAKCSNASSYTEVSNGSTTNFSCSGSLAVRVSGSSSLPYLVAFNCGVEQAQSVTVTAGSSANTLDFSVGCVSK